MNLNYKLTNTDFIQYQMFSTSKSKLDNKKRFRSRILFPIILTGLAIYMLVNNENTILAVVYLSLSLLWFFLYPTYSKWRVKKYFERHVAENYANRIGTDVKIEFKENLISMSGLTSQSEINKTELKELIETEIHFFLKMATGLSLIIPKRAIKNQFEFKAKVTDLGAEYVNEINWQWK